MAAVSVDRRDASAPLAFSSLSYQPTSCARHTTHAIHRMLCEQLCNCQISDFQEVLLNRGLMVLLLHDGHLRGSPCGARLYFDVCISLSLQRSTTEQAEASSKASRKAT